MRGVLSLRIERRGGVDRQVVYVILAAVVLLILVTLIPNIANQINTTTRQTSCRASVESLERLHINGVQVSPDEVSCPTEEITIRSDDSQTMKKEIADAMVGCWSDFKEGRPTIFSESRTYCALCSVIDFQDKDRSLGHFTEFLATQPLPSNRSKTYMDYLMRYENPRAREIIDDPSIFDSADTALDDRIDTSKRYAVVFVYAKGKTAIENVIDYFGRGTTSLAMGFGAWGTTTLATGTAAVVLGASPVGWITAGTVGFGFLVGSGTALKTYFADEDDEPHLAFIMLQEHTPRTFKDLGCEYYPASQENYKYEDG